MFIVVKSRLFVSIFLFCALVLGVGCLYWTPQSSTADIPGQNFCVVLDAGHGGIDVGSIGRSTGAYERDINLAVTNKIEGLLRTMNIRVVQTRQTEDGLYGVFASGFKKRDMAERKRIIEDANPNLVVSVHMNFFPDSSAHGSQVFYKPGDETSNALAVNMQKLFVKNLHKSRQSCAEGDFFVLTSTRAAGILVEGGYLSNPEDEALLVTDEYQTRLAYQIFCGIVQYFDLTNF